MPWPVIPGLHSASTSLWSLPRALFTRSVPERHALQPPGEGQTNVPAPAARFLRGPMTPRSPVIAIYGSSFPVWLFAALAGMILALVLREVLIVTGLARHLPAPAVFHLSVAVLSGVGLYVLWIGGYQ